MFEVLVKLFRYFRSSPEADEPEVIRQDVFHGIRTGILKRPVRGPVLMLDFDGVLHPGQSGSLCHLPVLEAWLRQNGEVDVVISSNWRDSHTLDQLSELFASDLQDRIVGTIPSFFDGCRENEILAYIRKYGIARWAAIDDRAEEFPTTGRNHLVATEYREGLNSGHLGRVARILGLQNRKIAE